uniref:Uncharacterized protein n=1 Tax=Tetradesmus obliquus TaxID=3088 RepID=A0A383VIS9_TETOB|eukprot:jgi/Sobl393_1/1478/SZX64843.1
MLQAATAEQPTAPESATTAATAASAPCSSTTTLQTQQQQQQQGLRLRSFSTNVPAAASSTALLPAHSLTHLQLTLMDSSTASLLALRDGISADPALAAATARLTNLQQLVLECDAAAGALPGLTNLRHLTSLEVMDSVIAGRSQWKKPLKQLLAHPLPLQRLHISTGCGVPGPGFLLDLLRQSQLLNFSIEGQLHEGSQLPVQLQRLQFCCERSWASDPIELTQLLHLQHLHLAGSFPDPSILLQPSQLPCLQHLALQHWEVHEAAAAAAVWLQLP